MSMYGKSQSPRKTMAMGQSGAGNFGVEAMPSSNRPTHPDAAANTGRKAELADGFRGAGPAIGKGPAMQAAPDHGSPGMDHFRRAGKA